MKKDGSILQMSRKYKLQLMLSLGSPNNYLRFWNYLLSNRQKFLILRLVLKSIIRHVVVIKSALLAEKLDT